MAPTDDAPRPACRHARLVLYPAGYHQPGECQECHAEVPDVLKRLAAAEAALARKETTPPKEEP